MRKIALVFIIMLSCSISFTGNGEAGTIEVVETVVDVINGVKEFMGYRAGSFDALAMANIKNAYTTAQIYFDKFPDDTVTLDNLQNAGFQKNEDVRLIIESGTKDGLAMKAFHVKGDKVYLINSEGEITFETR